MHTYKYCLNGGVIVDEIREESMCATVFGSVFYAALFLVAYMAIIFENLPGMDYWASLRVFGWTCLPAISISILLNAFRTDFSRKIFNVTLPLGIYTVITYFSEGKVWFILLGAAVLAATAFYGFLIFSQRIKNKRRARLIRRARLRKFLKGTEAIVNCAMAAIVIGIYALVLVTGFSIASPAESVKSFEEAKGYTIEANAERLRPIACGGWEELTVSEKLEVLQVIANIETGALGCDTNLRVGAGARSDGVLGSYNGKKNCITIDRDYLEESSAGDALRTVLHECRYAYQRMLVKAYEDADEPYKSLAIFKDAKKLREGFENYTQAEYYSNPVEADAREYSELRAKDYYSEVRRKLFRD